jgi:hypothetical protein
MGKCTQSPLGRHMPQSVLDANKTLRVGRYGVVLDAGSSVSTCYPQYRVLSDTLKGDTRPHIPLAEQPQSEREGERGETTQPPCN